MCRRSTWLLASVLLVLAGICRAERPATDRRELVVVQVVHPQRDGKTVDNLINSLRGVLLREKFKVSVQSSGTLTGGEILAQNRQVHHVVADIVVGDHGHLEASVYNQGADSPKVLQADSEESLTAQVVQYLESEPMVQWRLDRTAAIADAFTAAINSGLGQMRAEKDLNQAVAAFLKAVDLKPDSALPHFNLAVCYYRQADYDKCREHVDAGLKLDPENRDLKNQKAILLMRDGHPVEGTRILEGLGNDDPIVQWNLAYGYFQQQKSEKAKEHLVRLLALDPDSTSTLRTIATSRLDELQKAEDELQKKESSLRFMKRALWFALGGLVCLLISALIIIVLRHAGRDITSTRLQPKDALALKIQVGIASVGTLSTILTIVLGRLFGT